MAFKCETFSQSTRRRNVIIEIRLNSNSNYISNYLPYLPLLQLCGINKLVSKSLTDNVTYISG